MKKNVMCPYCLIDCNWVENKEIYGKNYGKSYMCWLCEKCEAYVGCHNNSKKPLGTPANKELRELRKKCHSLIDPLWRDYSKGRNKVYIELKKNTGISHIGESSIEDCKKIIEVYSQKEIYIRPTLESIKKL